MTRRDEQKEKRKEQILFTALNLFVRKGYTATTIADIACGANMSNGLLFHYFKSKEALYEELVKIGLMGTQMSMKFQSKDPLDFFRQTAIILFNAVKESDFVAKMFVLMGMTMHTESVPKSVGEIVRSVNNIQSSVHIIVQGQQMGLIRDGDPLALSGAFWSSVQGIAESLAAFPDLPCPDPEWIVDIIKK